MIPGSAPDRRRIVVAAVLDVVAIGLFATLGRSSHDAGVTLGGVASTMWPFLVGAAVGWLAASAWLRPTRIVPTAVVVWVATVAVGMVLRALSGQGTAASFVVVASVFLAATLVGWRVLAGVVARTRARRSPATEPTSPVET